MAWRNMHLADDALRRALDKRLLGEVGCSLLEHDLLAWLSAAPQQRRQMLDLADRLGVTRGGLTRIIDRVVERGWVERDRPEGNRREVFAVLTPDGGRFFKRARAVYLTQLNETLGAHLNDDELGELNRITGKLLASINREISSRGSTST